MNHSLLETRFARNLIETYGREVAEEVVRRVAEAESVRMLQGEMMRQAPALVRSHYGLINAANRGMRRRSGTRGE